MKVSTLALKPRAEVTTKKNLKIVTDAVFKMTYAQCNCSFTFIFGH